MKTHIRPLVFAIFAAAITGCASIAPLDAAPVDAKQALSDAMHAQLRQSFGYHTQIHVSNTIREEALAQASEEQKSASSDIMTACEDAHDAAYVSLTKKLMAEQGVLVDAIEKTEDFETLKQTYQSCVNERNAIFDTAESFDAEAFFERTQDMTVDAQFDLLYEELQAHENQADAVREASIATYQAAHDGQHTALDAKKADLLSAYLISPTQLSMIGNYQPLAGKISVLPAAHYQAKNLNFYVNQPLYIDLQQGIIYLWADNFAMVNSETIDKSLGDKWRNKWLAFHLNDGSLPKSFSRDLITFIMDAKKQSFDSLNVSAFDLINSDQMLATPHLMTNLSEQAITTIKGTGSIIRVQPQAADRAYARYLFADTLYHSIVGRYSEFSEPSFGNIERSIIEGKSVIEVVNAEDTDASFEAVAEEVKIDSKLFVRMLLNALNQVSQSYQADVQMGGEVSQDGQQGFWHYGLKSGGISWIHQRQYLANPTLPKEHQKLRHEQPMIIDTFTTITRVHPEPFARLPAAHRTPNADNSINISDYGQDLVKRIQSGDDKYSKILLALFSGEGSALDVGDEFELPTLPDEPEPDELDQQPKDNDHSDANP
ncbi:hypothetical protein [Moraxella porci]|uniref:hypothetical protein n=1 Tax=Moraxella porci TaxID=1288392 RepID=UPI00244710C0|nr:hypothetical protein [Moraxella porci]MDH2272472.1 hypothetical protein [Moraxella porci]